MTRFALLLMAVAGCASSHTRDLLPIAVENSDAATGTVAPGVASGAAVDKRVLMDLPVQDAASGAESSSGAAGQDVTAAAADAAISAAAGLVPDAGTHSSAERPTASRDRATVWIGESEKTVTYPEFSGGAGPPQRVVLILDALRDRATGTVTFGMGSLPEANATDTFYPPGATDVDVLNWVEYPIQGFDYSVVAASLNDDLLSFAFVPLEFYRDFCALRTSDPPLAAGMSRPHVCQCASGRCYPADGPQRRIDLKVVGDTMEGELSGLDGGWLNDQPIIRLRRVQ